MEEIKEIDNNECLLELVRSVPIIKGAVHVTERGRAYSHTPESLIKAFEKYITRVKNSPFIKQVATKAGAVDVQVNAPLTKLGFCIDANIDITTLENWTDKSIMMSEDSDEFEHNLFSVATRIKDIIQDRQIAGSIVNEYNANMVMVLNRMKDETTQPQQQLQNINIVIDGKTIDIL